MNLNSDNQKKTHVNADSQKIEEHPVSDVLVQVQANKGTIKISGGVASAVGACSLASRCSALQRHGGLIAIHAH